MPEPTRQPFRMNARGINLTQPIDQMPEGDFPFLQNVRALQQGGLTAIPGQNPISSAFSVPNLHSIRRLDTLVPSPQYALVVGGGGNLYIQSGASAPILVDTGYSGNPLSLIRYRPDQATQARMYVGDYAKMSKVDVNGGVQNVGIAPPTVPPEAEVHGFTFNTINDFPSAAGWGTIGIASAPTALTRGSASSIIAILYDSGTTGWATVAPFGPDWSWLGAGARLKINGTETVTVQEVAPAISATTIQGIVYDSGATGLATLVLTDQSAQVQRNSIIQLGGFEYVRVLSVTQAPDSQTLSLRVSTFSSWAAGATVTGLTSFRAHFFGTFIATNSIATNALGFLLTPTTSPANDTGSVTFTEAHDFSKYQPDDYMHISLYLDVPLNLVSGRLLLDVDATTNNFTQNYYEKNFTASDLGDIGDKSWHELYFKISDLVRIGDDFTRTLGNIAALAIEFTVSATTSVRVSSWWVGGTYGPDVPPGSLEGLIYRYRYRASTTGVRSVPGPATRYGVFPHRQQVLLSVTQSSDPQVDEIDIERLDPNLQAPAPASPTFTFVTSVPNATSTVYQDNLSPSGIAANPPLETNVLQPFPVLGPVLRGQVNVIGTQVLLLSGNPFPTNLAAGTVILIHGVAYQTYGQPLANALQITASGGTQTNVGYEIASPILPGTGLPFVFGPLEGPTASFSFGIGDVNNPGTLYWTNGNDPDSAASGNSIEVTPPSEPLVSGAVWNNYVFVGSRERLFMIQPTFDQPNLFTPLQIPAASGPWTPWVMKPGLDGVYYQGRDGIYRAVPYAGASLISPDLWPLFPHQGSPGTDTNGLLPVNMDSMTPGRVQPRIGIAEEDVYFDYPDSSNAIQTLRYSPGNIGGEQPLRGWFPESRGFPVNYHYFEEVPFGGNPRLLELTQNSLVMAAGGTSDNGVVLTGTVQTPALHNGDSRGQKLYMDTISDLVGKAQLTLGFNFNETVLPALPIAENPRGQFILPIDTILYAAPNLSVNLPLFINITGTFTWNAADGTILYEFQPCFYPQPYLVENVVTQYTDHGIPGWKTPRFARMGYISSAPLVLTITTNEDTTAQYNLPAHTHLYTADFNLTAPGLKGRMYAYDLRSPNCVPFVFFREESYIKMKHWRGQEFSEVRPFLDGP